MEAFFISAVTVGLAEIGDKTQIVALMLAARFPRPVPLLLGILCAKLLNHGAAGLVATLLGSMLDGPWMGWALGISFMGVAIWALFPDRYEAKGENVRRFGAFMSSLLAFFLAEIGDKTQIVTIALAARFEVFFPVVLGTTLGMMAANIPAVVIGNRMAKKLPLRAIRIASAIPFAGLGAATLLG
ncbi:MAG: TMEM165/GDT1 family protein [Alphaproteobacteria bacterium]|nr:TMEM165/GDT1 family protein [Alphaproteobacteria bacterium]